MKKLKLNIYGRLLAGGLLAASALIGCKKFISPDPLSSFSQAQIFSSLPYAQSAVIGIYNDMANQNYYGLYISMVYPFDTDEFMGAPQSNTQGDNNSRDLARWNVTAQNGVLAAPYTYMYQGIERANICIDQIPKMALYTSGSAQVKGELQRLYGEALTLRALFYSDLIKNWGDVPEDRLPAAKTPNLFLPRTNRDTIYNHIIADLKMAEDLLPWRTDVGKLGDNADERVTKGAAKALRARIALFRGGYSLRPTSNQMERPADYLTYYQIARDECADLMARRDEHTLNPSYRAVWHDYICGRNANEPNGELMFQVPEGGNGTGSADGRIGIYNGTKVGTSSNGSIDALPTYFYYFDSTDVRRDVTIAPYVVNNDLTTKKGNNSNTMSDGKFRRDWWSNPVNPLNATLNSGINWPLIRFSDVLLMFAEADNELNKSPNAADIAAVNEVSKRAHNGNQALVQTIPTDYTNFFKYIVRERLLEFGDEGIRKYDLLRWNLIATCITETRANLAAMSATVPYAITPPSYMAPPPSYCISASLPTFMYYITTSTADDYHMWANSLYKPSPAVAPAGTGRSAWIGYSGITTSITNIFAFGFKPNHAELLPLHISIINNSNGVLFQEYGY